LDISPAVEEQLESGILFPGDSLVKNDVSPGDLFEDFLSDNTLEGKFLYIFKGRQVFFFFYLFLSLSLKRCCKSEVCYLSREGQKIFHKYFAMQKILHHSCFV
jgi:hypothetical protein